MKVEIYKGRKIKVRKRPGHWGQLILSVNGELAGIVTGFSAEDSVKQLEQLKRDVDAADERRLTDPDAFPAAWYKIVKR